MPPDNSVAGTHDRNVTHNNTRVKNTDNTPKAPKGAWLGFDEFWSAYPKKVSKPDALTMWSRKKPDLAEVLAGLYRWKASEQWTKDGGRYVPNPATWLNRENWKDVVESIEKRHLTAEEIAQAEKRSAE